MSTAGWLAGTEALLDEILTDAHGDDEQLWALRQAFEDEVCLPVDAFVIGEPVEVTEIDYDGNSRRGLTARCRQDGGDHVVAASEVAFPDGSKGARHLAAYRKWLGLEPAVVTPNAPTSWWKRHKAAEEDLDLSAPIELVVLAPKERAARCRIHGTEREITLRSSDVWNMVPGEIVTVRARKQWRYAGHPYLSGNVESHRLDVGALGLVATPTRGRVAVESKRGVLGRGGRADRGVGEADHRSRSATVLRDGAGASGRGPR